MLISELIEILEAYKQKLGDIRVYIRNSNSAITMYVYEKYVKDEETGKTIITPEYLLME